MKKNLGLWIVLGIFAVVLIAAGVLYRQLGDQWSMGGPVSQTAPTETTAAAEASHPEETTQPLAPDFTVTDREGNAVSLSDFRGKPVIVNFWASWCGPCKSEMPEIEAAYQAYGGDIHFLIVNMTDGSRETVEAASDYITGQGYTFPVYYDTMQDAAITYGVYSIPATYFIAADGSPVAYYKGSMSESILAQGIDMLLPES